MKTINRNVLMLTLAAALFAGCERSGPPPRKKMPELAIAGDDLNPINAVTDSMQNVFSADVQKVSFNGKNFDFLSLSFNKPQDDDALINLVTAFKPFATSLLPDWYHQHKKGIMIDLRMGSSQQQYRSDYWLDKQHAFSIPVIILWDTQSAYRLEKLHGIITADTGISLKNITGELNSDTPSSIQLSN